MDASHQLHPTTRFSRNAMITVYRTPSSRDAAATAADLSQHIHLLEFLPGPAVMQAAPGVYEVRVTYTGHEAARKSALDALNRLLRKILLARLDAPTATRTSFTGRFATTPASAGARLN